jgi:phosphoribosylamine--glycine ligase
MSRFLLLSEGGDGVGLALRLKNEGHECPVWHRDPSAEKHGKGLVAFADDYKMGQTLVADCTGFGLLLDKWRDEGIKVFGGSTFADRLETDRQFSEEIMEQAGIETPISARAKSWGEATKIVKKIAAKSEKVVLKPEGALSGNVPSYVASDEEDALKMLEHFQKNYMGDEVELTIQEFVEGVALSTEGWFNGEEWIPGMWNHTIERKQFLDGDLGPSGGCSGNLVWKCRESESLVKKTLLRITDLLRERRYIGPIDINCVVSEGGIYGLEFTPRFGYDALPTLLYSLCGFDFGAFIESCASGEVPDVELKDGFAAGVRLTLPPYPSSKGEASAGIPIRGFREEDKLSFYPYNVALQNEELESSGGVGILGVMNGIGECVGEAFAKAYEILSRLKIPEVQYRTDLSEACLKDYRELERIMDGDEELEGWLGVDLDGTLAEYSGYKDEIGAPIPKMVSRVKRWIAEGKQVRILTARGTQGAKKYESLLSIYEWSRQNIGQALEVTDKKDPQMIRLYDDRVRQVEEGTGELVAA